MSTASHYNYPQETLLAFCIAIMFLFSSGTRVNYTPIPVTVKTLAPKKKAEDDEEEIEIEQRITWKQLRLGLERYNAEVRPIKARRDSMRRRAARKLDKLKRSFKQEGLEITYTIQ